MLEKVYHKTSLDSFDPGLNCWADSSGGSVLRREHLVTIGDPYGGPTRFGRGSGLAACGTPAGNRAPTASTGASPTPSPASGRTGTARCWTQPRLPRPCYAPLVTAPSGAARESQKPRTMAADSTIQHSLFCFPTSRCSFAQLATAGIVPGEVLVAAFAHLPTSRAGSLRPSHEALGGVNHSLPS